MKKDLFTESARLARVTKSLRESFEMWNYKEVFLPSVERYDHRLRKGLKMATHDDYYLIKPDVTSQIAVNIKDDRSLRLFYISEVLDGLSGEWQAGLEFMGGRREEMEAEVLRIVMDSLDRLKISDYYVDIGSLKAWKDAIKEIPEREDAVFNALRSRNFGIIEELELGEEKTDELWDLFNFRDDECGSPRIDAVVRELNDHRIFIDLGTVRPLPYYDDMIVEVYSPDLGYPIGAGGDYVVNDLQAFGFAFKLKGLVELQGGMIP